MDELNFAVHILRAEVHVGGVIEYHRAHFEQPREEGSHAPKLVLAPVLVWMVMALRAVEAASEEDPNFFGRRLDRAQRSEEHTSETQSTFKLLCLLLLAK